MDKPFLSELEKTMNGELEEANRDCLRRRTVLMDLLVKIRKEKEMAGLV